MMCSETVYGQSDSSYSVKPLLSGNIQLFKYNPKDKNRRWQEKKKDKKCLESQVHKLFDAKKSSADSSCLLVRKNTCSPIILKNRRNEKSRKCISYSA